MTRTSPTRWGSQLVMWSSPVLLLVMLFTMTTSARTTRPIHVPLAARSPTPNVAPRSTPSTTSPDSRTSAASTPRAPITATTLPRSATRGPSFTAIASNANSDASGAGATVAIGAVAGALAGGQVVDLPLSGPGSWALSASAPVLTRLVCPRSNTSFPNLIVIDSAQTCQLLITSSTSSATSWRLAPRP